MSESPIHILGLLVSKLRMLAPIHSIPIVKKTYVIALSKAKQINKIIIYFSE
jgi:hypothetical protein